MFRTAIQRLLILVIVLSFVASCRQGTLATGVPASKAYSDGFEVVVFDVDGNGTPNNVRSLLLAEAEKAIAAGANATLPDDTTSIEAQMSAGKAGDSRAVATVAQIDKGKQLVRLAFHQSMRTYVYEYVVEGNKVTPVSSSYSDLAKSTSVKYSQE